MLKCTASHRMQHKRQSFANIFEFISFLPLKPQVFVHFKHFGFRMWCFVYTAHTNKSTARNCVRPTNIARELPGAETVAVVQFTGLSIRNVRRRNT